MRCNVPKQAVPRVLFIAFLISTFTVLGPERSPDPCECSQSPPCCVHSFLSYKVLDRPRPCMCALVVCFVLVNEVKFVQVLINKYVIVLCFSYFLFPVFTAHMKQPRKGAKGQTMPEGPRFLG